MRTIDRRLLRTWRLPVPRGGGKDVRGSVVIIAGSREMPGAPILAAVAALRAGAGRLRILTARSVAAHVAAAIPESLVEELRENDDGGLSLTDAARAIEVSNAADAVVFGPGMRGERSMREFLPVYLQGVQRSVILDALALSVLRDCSEGGALPREHILTPHSGEMAALLGRDRQEIEHRAKNAALDAARHFGAVVAHKGVQTYVATPAGEVLCNRAGGIGLATSGSGDALAGVIGGILARCGDLLHATCWGVHVHARAGEVLEQRMGIGFLARELLDEIPAVVRALS